MHLKIVSVAALLLPLRAAAALTGQYPELVMHGESYLNTCNPDEKRALFEATIKRVKLDPHGAWRAISTVLCAPGTEANRDYVAGLIPPRMRQNVSSTGNMDEVLVVARSRQLVDEVLAKGSAWSPTLRTEPGKIYLHYFKDEACVKEVVLSFVKRK
jgi:hypothetical protein